MYDICKDIIIPLIGAIAVPLLVWYLTRYYGADKAEERKDLRELRDNLNFLSSLTYSNLDKFIALKERTQELIKIESRTEGNLDQNDLEFIFNWLIIDDYFEIIDVSKYSKCISYDKDFVFELVKVKNVSSLCHNRILVHNQKMEKAGPIDELVKDIPGAQNIIKNDCRENKEFYQEINNAIIKCDDLIKRIEQLGNKVSNLNLIKIEYETDFLPIIKQSKAEYLDFLRKEIQGTSK